MSCYNDHFVIMFYHMNFGIQNSCSTIWGINIPRSVLDVVFFARRISFLRRRRRTGVLLYPSAIACELKWVKVWKIKSHFKIYGSVSLKCPFPPNQAFLTSLLQNKWIFSENINFSEDLYFWLQNTGRALLKHLIPDSSKSLYLLPIHWYRLNRWYWDWNATSYSFFL